MWIKLSHIPDKGGEIPSESSHEGEVTRQEEEQKGESWFQGEAKPSLDGGKHPSECKWLNLSNFVNFMLALIVLSSITKKGEIVKNMAPFIPFRVILMIV